MIAGYEYLSLGIIQAKMTSGMPWCKQHIDIRRLKLQSLITLQQRYMRFSLDLPSNLTTRMCKVSLDKEKAERETKEAEDKAEQEKKEAAEKAERDKEAAIEEERKRVAAVEESERQAEEKLAKNKAHRGKLNKEAKKSFIDEGFEDEEAERIIKVIAKGRIANITINY